MLLQTQAIKHTPDQEVTTEPQRVRITLVNQKPEEKWKWHIFGSTATTITTAQREAGVLRVD